MKFESPPWVEIDTVMFDMDGTLLDLHFDNFFWRDLVPEIYAKNKSISKEEALAMITENYKQVEGTLNWYSVDYFIDLMEEFTLINKDRSRIKMYDLLNSSQITSIVTEFFYSI